MARMSATEAARGFSDVLNRVAAGDEIEVIRNGAAVATIGPPKVRLMPAAAFRELMASAPPVDDRFAEDLREIRRGAEAPADPWDS